MKFFNDLFTGKDNKTFDYVRVCGVFGFFVLSYKAIVATSFNPLEWSGAFSAYLAANGVALSIKRKTEPDIKNDV